MIIKDRDGNRLVEIAAEDSLDSRDLRRADFSGQQIEGIYLAQSDLSEADFSGADMYWANGFEGNFDGAILREALLSGANLERASFRNADLRGACLSCDNLGGSATLAGADLTGALLDGANLTGCLFDNATRFPLGFSPETAGMKSVEPNRIYVRSCALTTSPVDGRSYIRNKDNPEIYIPDKNS